MKLRSIEGVALATAAGAAATGVLVVLLLQREPWWLAALLAAAVSFFVLSLWSLHLLNGYVAERLRPIYRIALHREAEPPVLHARADPVHEAERCLNTWAEHNRQELERLRENEKYRREFLGNVAHEIKTPVFNIQGYLTTLLDGGLEDDLINRKYLERSERSIRRLLNIVNDLDAIAQLESDVARLRVESFDIQALAREIADGLEIEAAGRRIRLEVEEVLAHPDDWMVEADRHYIGQVLVNLVANAIHYGREGGKARIGFVDLFDKVLVEVTDDGIGIAPEDQLRVFERFFRTDKSRSREEGGTGLGLAICKHVVEAHGESITLRSEPGRGSTFSFTLRKTNPR